MNNSHILGMQGKSSGAEQLVSGIGATIAISAIFYIGFLATNYQGAMAILPSMGAAAVILFCIPHSPLAQPWPLLCGNVLSAAVGVSCARYIGNPFLAGGLAVGLSVYFMYVFRCVHPPGGATALAAVIGGDSLQGLGYWYLLTPVLLNCMVIFLIAVFFNNIFPWRRYPISRMRFERHAVEGAVGGTGVDESLLRRAMDELKTSVDISEEQIGLIVNRASEIHSRDTVSTLKLEVGAYYTNGKSGAKWSIRKVVDEVAHADPSHHLVVYRTVDGDGVHRAGSCTRSEFAVWAKERARPVSK
ncbi:MAG: HPP family protein [Spongiibacteraceae bacterium]